MASFGIATPVFTPYQRNCGTIKLNNTELTVEVSDSSSTHSYLCEYIGKKEEIIKSNAAGNRLNQYGDFIHLSGM